ncbi:phosphotransferase [Sporolactobacillus shoreicorticis]|uniref:Phosphotransferase enzyme family protein n=1 Tax=Sporolactobacillus shoreicorticis TaxID=1923877 RepID=A0ABW5S7N3_9BACL|nr:phosphotransferase [Sporolactobacillus shoreicorticis]MCO7126885.1 phosphotransferase [Sporolactobacillus shoreicorticis]
MSSNAVYPFYHKKQLSFLRFAPVEEKTQESVQAELDFLEYLRENDYSVAEHIPSKKGLNVVLSETPWGKYVAVAFKGACGNRLDQLECSNDLYYGLGASLGHLHLLSAGYHAKDNRRTDWKQNLNWVETILKKYSAPAQSLKEVTLLRDFFEKLPVTPQNYGLIHYDFELDNVFCDEETHRYTAIDFDDAVYHWFVMDIDQAIDSIKDELPKHDHEPAEIQFLSGYRSIMEIEDSMLEKMPIFRRYANLFSYARCLHCLADTWDYEPEWMVGLRNQIIISMDNKSKTFGENVIPVG